MDLKQTVGVSAGGMMAQTLRMKVAAENIANADSVQSADGSGPYVAKQVTFKSVYDRATGTTRVAGSVSKDTQTPMPAKYEPNNPLADAKGFVQLPNVDITIENLNMKEAQRSYEANLAAMTTAQEMVGRTLDMMR